MTDKDMFAEVFPQERQIGGIIIKTFIFSHMNLYQKIIYRSSKVT